MKVDLMQEEIEAATRAICRATQRYCGIKSKCAEGCTAPWHNHVNAYVSKDYWLATIPHFAAKWPEVQQARLRALQEAKATIAFWRSDESGRACNGGSNEPVKPGLVETTAGPLKICTARALHATFIPPKWEGSRWWIVALIGEVHEQDGALQREIIGEAL